jgi:hypothetical protein
MNSLSSHLLDEMIFILNCVYILSSVLSTRTSFNIKLVIVFFLNIFYLKIY